MKKFVIYGINENDKVFYADNVYFVNDIKWMVKEIRRNAKIRKMTLKAIQINGKVYEM